MKAWREISGERTRLACRVWRPRRTLSDQDRALPLRSRAVGEGASGSTRGRVRSPDLRIRACCVVGLLFAAITATIWLALPKPPLLDGIPFSQCVRDRHGRLLRLTLTSDQKFRVWTPLREISPELIDATLQYEDKYYAHHPGVNPFALLRSGYHLLHGGGTRSGGSTITMQLARLRFHLQTRTFTGKLTQIRRALEIERHYSKTEILEAYLNLAPYGRNIEGIGAATQIYFEKAPARLTDPEAVALSVIPQRPSRRALLPASDNRSVNFAQNNWYNRAGLETNADFSPRLFQARAKAPGKMLAPHFVQQVLQNNKSGKEISTTLDLEKQELIERRVTDYVAANRTRGIQNAAVMLADTRTMDVLAQVGSADFANVEINGQVDGTRSARSPGSTLKPFVYALAIEQGLIHPLSILADAPHSFGDYNPENFDREFLGPIRATDALARSRNIPAVTLTAQLSHPTLYEFLRRTDVKLAHPESHYGLALPLGGAEVTMEDLVRLYAVLANNGELRPLRRTSRNHAATTSRRVLSPEAAFLTLEMLGNVPRPEMNCADAAHTDRVFWKTGTSHGFHDAWSIAVFDHYVLAVWIGNFDGKPNNGFVGRTAAAPLLFQIIDSLRATWPEQTPPHTPPPGANLKRVEFCATSGDLPEPWCTQRVEGWFIPGISPIKTCSVHREVLVDAATGLRVPIDDGTLQLRREVYEFWPSDLLALFQRAGVPRRAPPPFMPGRAPDLLSGNGQPPRIIAPVSGETREVIFAATKSETVIPLRAKVEADVREIYWFAGKTFIGKATPAEIVSWKSTPGRYELTALDDQGRSGSCTVVVR
jgi:penicillin-binding protein 1C